MIAPVFEGLFRHSWTAEVLPNRPMILPARHYVYPLVIEEVEKGALEVLVQPGRADSEPFLATFALGFRDPAAATGIWSMPHADWLCAVSGGYAYIVNVENPVEFTHLRYEPVLDAIQYSSHGSQYLAGKSQYGPGEMQSPPPQSNESLLLFLGHHSILAWGPAGEAWESDRVSWEGIKVDEIKDGILHGQGWDMATDRDLPFALDLKTGMRV